ncbi:MAG: hypothetical protein M1326_00100, partial [Cyanobacteria bacterium]|nr:hypothetical protein [Cyanobacteriota bacterium]
SLTDARYYLIAHGGLGPRLIAIESLNLFIFLLFYLGTRFLGLIYLLLLLFRKKLDSFDFSILVTIAISIILTVTLVQKAQWWNVIQFFIYVIFLLTIYLTKLVYSFIKRKNVAAYTIVVIIVILSMPTSFDLVRQFVAIPGATYVSQDELKALDFLKKQPSGVILTPLFIIRSKIFMKFPISITKVNMPRVIINDWKMICMAATYCNL